jgi:hypothetical protein
VESTHERFPAVLNVRGVSTSNWFASEQGAFLEGVERPPVSTSFRQPGSTIAANALGKDADKTTIQKRPGIPTGRS